jgi:hypothetical protein
MPEVRQRATQHVRQGLLNLGPVDKPLELDFTIELAENGSERPTLWPIVNGPSRIGQRRFSESVVTPERRRRSSHQLPEPTHALGALCMHYAMRCNRRIPNRRDNCDFV